MAVVRVLGVDPGTVRCGWGIVDSSGSRLERVASGVIQVGRGDIAPRLAKISEHISAMIVAHQPDSLSLERSFLARNVQSAFRLGEARGAIMAVSSSAGLTVAEYAPTTLKKAVTGTGRADKAQIQAAISRLFGAGFDPAEDEADALAAAVCHALSAVMLSKIAQAEAQGQGQQKAATQSRRATSRQAGWGSQ
ncbi:MAG: crossover junction endodeoxyribonuclease RuvC [Hyphomicrobiaceae bacterium]